jgi:hypothetical protein
MLKFLINRPLEPIEMRIKPFRQEIDLANSLEAP